jgi:GT2 family glycosyltransferase
MSILDKTFVGIIHYGNDEVLTPLIRSFPENLPKNNVQIVNNNLNNTINIKNIQIQHFPENPGYAKGVNFLINNAKRQSYDFVIILNNDLVLCENALEILINQSEDRIAVQGATIGENGEYLTCQHLKYPYLFQYKSPQRHTTLSFSDILVTEFICGAFFCINLNRMNPLILFDEDFFMYYEDIEWSLRLKEAFKEELVVAPDAKAYHKESASTGGGITLKGMRLRLNSLKLFLKKSGLKPPQSFLNIFAQFFRLSLLWIKHGLRLN